MNMAQPNPVLIQNATIFTPQGFLEDGAIWIQDGRIQALGSLAQLPAPPGGRRIEAGGLILSPGWIDLQFNGGFGRDFTDEPECIWEVGVQLPQFGTTAFLPTIITSPPDKIDRAIEAWKQGPPPGYSGAIPLGLHIEGPFLNPAKKGAHNPQYLRQPDLDAVRQWHVENGVRLVTLAPELAGALDVIRELRARNIVLSAGHSMADFDQAQAGFQAGVSYGTHLFNAMPRLDHRSPGLIGALLNNPEAVIGVIVDGIHVHPAMVSLAWKAKGSQGLTLVTDAMAALGMQPGQYRLGDFDVTVDQTSARLSDGTLAGSILTQDLALRNLMDFTGCSLEEALPALTQTPAQVLGLTSKGRISPGYDADLTLLTPRGEVVAVFVSGELRFSSPGFNF
jgi:N-acetylglucosamine-6-phosphate deacetylase